VNSVYLLILDDASLIICNACLRIGFFKLLSETFTVCKYGMAYEI